MPKARTERVEVPSGEPFDATGNGITAATGTGGNDGDGNSNGSDGDDPSGSGAGDSGADSGANTGTGLGAGNGPSGTAGEYNDGDDRIIRDENGNPTYSPTGRLRKRRAARGTASEATEGKAGKKVSLKDLEEAIETNATLIYGGHFGIARVLAVPEMELNTDEAQMLSEAFTPLLVDNGVQPPKWAKDLSKIIIACSYVYMPRFKVIGDRLKAEKQAKANEKARREQTTVLPVTGVAGDMVFAPSPNMRGGTLDIQ